MRATFVLPTFSPSPIGGYAVVYEYATRLSERGWQVTVAHLTPPRLPRRSTFRHEVTKLFSTERALRDLPWAHIGPSVALSAMRSLDGRFLPDADITVLTAWETMSIMPTLSGRHGRVVQFVQDYEAWMTAEESRAEIEDALRVQPVVRIAISTAVAEMLTAIGSEYGAVIHSGLDTTTWFCDNPLETRDARILLPLRRGSKKGTSIALDAAVAIAAARPDWRFLGFGPSRVRVPQCVEHLGVVSTQRLRELYNEAAIFLLPSLYEGWGLPALEAMACGAAVVATANGGSEDFCSDMRNSLLIKPGDPEAIVTAVDRLILDPDLRQRLAANGLRTASDFSWDRSTDRFESVLRDTR